MPKAGKLRFVTELGLRIVELRGRQKLTQEKLAEAIGFSARYVQKVEAGEANVGLYTLGDLATALRCTVAELFVSTEHRIVRRAGRPSRGAAPKRKPRKR